MKKISVWKLTAYGNSNVHYVTKRTWIEHSALISYCLPVSSSVSFLCLTIQIGSRRREALMIICSAMSNVQMEVSDKPRALLIWFVNGQQKSCFVSIAALKVEKIGNRFQIIQPNGGGDPIDIGRNLYECGECEKSYLSSSYLKVHRKAKHSKGRPFECCLCHKTWVIPISHRLNWNWPTLTYSTFFP